MTLEEIIRLNDRKYRILRLLGKGKGGCSWLVSDENGQYVLKQIHHEPCSYYQFGNKLESELQDFQRMEQLGLPLPELIDVDVKHERILKQYIEGDTVFDCVLRDEMNPDWIRQMKEICQTVYNAGLNIDYFPTNFVVSQDRLWYIDYECNPYEDKWNFENWGSRYWSRTPEFEQYVLQMDRKRKKETEETI